MLLKFQCPHCEEWLKAGSDFAGKKANCPNCKKEITVPEESAEESKQTSKGK